MVVEFVTDATTNTRVGKALGRLEKHVRNIMKQRTQNSNLVIPLQRITANLSDLDLHNKNM